MFMLRHGLRGSGTLAFATLFRSAWKPPVEALPEHRSLKRACFGRAECELSRRWFARSYQRSARPCSGLRGWLSSTVGGRMEIAASDGVCDEMLRVLPQPGRAVGNGMASDDNLIRGNAVLQPGASLGEVVVHQRL